MYRQFRDESDELAALKAQWEATAGDGGWQAEQEELWRRIRARPAVRAPPASASAESHRRRWRSVRLFISSTFKDFYAERERLVKRVFPRLQDWCRRRRLTLYECDLRWGVPADSTGAHAVRTCLRLLDRCLADGAFFLGLVGDRFGWAPADEELDEELRQEYGWCSGSSVTQMEVVHGALAARSRNALFLLRHPASYDGMPEAQLKVFKEAPGSLAAAQMARHKLELASSFEQQQLRPYRLRYVGVVQDGRRQRVQFEGLDEFEEKVLEFFKAALVREFPELSEQQDEEEDSNDAHINYMLSLTSGCRGQERCQRLLRHFVELGELSTADFRLLGDSGDHIAFGMPGAKAVVVAGDTGCGKTAALARLGESFLDRAGFEVFAHFAQLTPASNDRRTLQRKLRAFLKSLLPPGAGAELSDDCSTSELLPHVMRLRRSILIIVDAFDCFYEVSHIGELLPDVWPPNVKCVLSCRTKDLERCFLHRSAYLYELESLDGEAREGICRSFMAQFGKQLDAEQLRRLVAKEAAANPLWLTQACEELRVFGDYSALSQMIVDLPDDTKELLKSIAGRLVRDSPDGSVAALLSLTAVARVGLWESEARRLLQFALAAGRSPAASTTTDAEVADELPLAEYLRLRRETKNLLRSVVREASAVVFRHGLARTAVQELLLPEPDSAKAWHSLLADFVLANPATAGPLLCRDLPYHLYWSDRRSELHAVLSDAQRRRQFAVHVSSLTAGAVYASWRCRNPKVAGAPPQAAVVVCNFCKNLPARAGAVRSASCLFCGNALLHSRPGAAVPAATCQAHQAPHPSFLRCWYCAKVDANGQQLFLCSTCSAAATPSVCCYPIFENDFLFPGLVRNQIKKFGLVW